MLIADLLPFLFVIKNPLFSGVTYARHTSSCNRSPWRPRKLEPAQGAQRRSGHRRNALGPERSVRQTRTDHCDRWARQGMGVPSAFRTRQSAHKVQPRSRRHRGRARKGPQRAGRTPGVLRRAYARNALDRTPARLLRGLRDVDLPFLALHQGVEVEELPIWHENGEAWRPLRLTFCEKIATHSKVQTIYAGDDGLLRRHDYAVEIAGDAAAAHYLRNYVTVDGIKFPAERRVYVVGPDGK